MTTQSVARNVGEVKTEVRLDAWAGKAFIGSSDGSKTYTVDLRANTCSCPDFRYRGGCCKHLQAARQAVVSATVKQDAAEQAKAVATLAAKAARNSKMLWPSTEDGWI